MKLKRLLKFGLFVHYCSKLLDKALGRLMMAETTEEAAEPLFYIHKLADMEHPHALAALGFIYADDTKPWYDKEKAVEYWQKAAEVDGGESFYDLGTFYFVGRKDQEIDPVSGKYYMNKAAAAGQKEAIEFLKYRYGDC